MAETFIGDVKTIWGRDHRDMKLLEDFSYIDPNNKEWKVPQGSFLNGATIPRSLWTLIGSPYVGKYRRASVIHDYFVGEGYNPEVSNRNRKMADKMFYRACKHDGCSNREASILYIGVRIGTWYAGISSLDRKAIYEPEINVIGDSVADMDMKDQFHKICLELKDNLDKIDFDTLESKVSILLGQ